MIVKLLKIPDMRIFTGLLLSIMISLGAIQAQNSFQ